MTVDDTGTFYAADTSNNRVWLITAEGTFLSMFKTKRKWPFCVICLESILFITHRDCSGITMYTTSGECISSIVDTTVLPRHLAVDSVGYFYC